MCMLVFLYKEEFKTFDQTVTAHAGCLVGNSFGLNSEKGCQIQTVDHTNRENTRYRCFQWRLRQTIAVFSYLHFISSAFLEKAGSLL